MDIFFYMYNCITLNTVCMFVLAYTYLLHKKMCIAFVLYFHFVYNIYINTRGAYICDLRFK